MSSALDKMHQHERQQRESLKSSLNYSMLLLACALIIALVTGMLLWR